MRILVATDLSEAADAALLDGTSRASARDALGVVHVLPPALAKSPPNERRIAAIRQRIGRVVERPHEVFVEAGWAHAEIVRRAGAWHADLVVVGAHGLSGEGEHVGGVAARVVRNAPCDVLVVRPTVARGWVLAATDLADPALHAIFAAAEEARRRGARLEVVQARGFLDIEATYLLELGSPSLGAHRRRSAVADERLAGVLERAGVDATSKILDKPPAAAVVRRASLIGAELIVVGAPLKTGLARLSFGGVAEKVIRAAPCSVLAVRRRPAEAA
jgi:nucleotide-binding universal stress UspA family protein